MNSFLLSTQSQHEIQALDNKVLDHTHTRLTALISGLPGWASTRKLKPIWISLKQETVSGSGISWAICKSAPRSRQITTPVPHHSVFYRPDALPAAQPTVSKHWRRQGTGCLLEILKDTAVTFNEQKLWQIYHWSFWVVWLLLWCTSLVCICLFLLYYWWLMSDYLSLNF